VKSFCGRDFDLESYEELIELDPYQTEFTLANFPLVTVTSLQDTASEDVDIYGQDNSAGIVQIKSSFWHSFPTIESRAGTFLTCEYQAGYSDAPADLKLAVFSIIEDRYRSGDSAIISERLGDRTYRKSLSGIPIQAMSILEQYRDM